MINSVSPTTQTFLKSTAQVCEQTNTLANVKWPEQVNFKISKIFLKLQLINDQFW